MSDVAYTPHLPPELWSKIFRAAAYIPGIHGSEPEYSLEPFFPSVRCLALQTAIRDKLSILLVCKAWYEIALPMLPEYISQGSSASSSWFIRIAKSLSEPLGPGLHPRGWYTRRLDIPRCIWPRNNYDEALTACLDLARVCERLEVIRMALWDDSTAWPHAFFQRSASSLRHLQLQILYFRSSFSFLQQFSRLESLYLIPGQVGMPMDDNPAGVPESITLPTVHTLEITQTWCRRSYQQYRNFSEWRLPSLQRLTMRAVDKSSMEIMLALLEQNGARLTFLHLSAFVMGDLITVDRWPLSMCPMLNVLLLTRIALTFDPASPPCNISRLVLINPALGLSLAKIIGDFDQFPKLRIVELLYSGGIQGNSSLTHSAEGIWMQECSERGIALRVCEKTSTSLYFGIPFAEAV